MDRLKFYAGSMFSTFMSVVIVGCCVEAGGFFNGLFTMGLGIIVILGLGIYSGYLAIGSFFSIERRIFLDYFFWIFVVGGALCSLIGGIIVLLLYGGCKYADSSSSSSNKGKAETYKVDKDVAGYDRIYNSKGEEVTSIDFVRDDGDIYGTDGKRYTPKH